ncbi:hypothetical protein SNE40_001464 [Patella caerulea]|uniref:Uncharacterized protein n=1 Tax=Patella caerulea TaxID=87958 RepID=A0AAN8KJD8_PATCE
MKLNWIKSFISEKERLETFLWWPLTHSARPYEFVQAGFYYSGDRDNVICAFCNGELSNWKPTDKPMEEHRRTFPDCIFVKDSMRSIQNGASPIVNKSAYYRQPVSNTAKSHVATMVQSSPVCNPPSLNRSTETQQSTVETNSKHIYLHPMDKP